MKQYLAAALAALVIGGAAVTTALSQQKPVPLRLGFVDVHKAFDTYRKYQQEMDNIKTKSDAFLGTLRKRAEQVENWEREMTTLNPGTPEYSQRERQAALERHSIDWDKKQKGRELEAEQRKKRTLIYKEICKEAGVYGQTAGLAAVFAYIPPEAEFEQDLDLIVPTRDLLWRDEQLDITADVVAQLNAQLPPAAPKAPDLPKPAEDSTKPK